MLSVVSSRELVWSGKTFKFTMLSSKRGNKLYHPFWYVITFLRFKQENDNSKGRLILIRLFGLFSITTRRVEDSYGGSWFRILEDIEVRKVQLVSSSDCYLDCF